MKIVKLYNYADQTGTTMYQNCRTEPKGFFQRRPDGNGDWINNLDGVDRLLFHLPQLLEASMQDFVWIAEGEKDVLTLEDLGFVATTSGSATSWKSEFARYFKHRLVCIVPHNDEDGRGYAKAVTDSLCPVAAEVRLIQLPGLPDKGDISDWIQEHTVEELHKAFNETPVFEPVETDAPQPEIVCLSDVESLPITWFWPNRIPCGMLTLLLGDPGLGKSFLSLYMAAKVSNGDDWPDDGVPGNCAPKGSTVILSAEDDLARTIRPRLDSLGADVTKVLAIKGVRLRDEKGLDYYEYFNLIRDLPALRKAIRSRSDTKLVIIDPLSAYLGKLDSHRDTDVRRVLAPLVQLAQDAGVAIVAVMHLNKSTGGKALYRGLGSIAFAAAARTVWLVSTDPDDPESRRRLLTPAKHNLLINPTGLAFEIIDGQVVFNGEPVTLTSDEALGNVGSVTSPEKDRAVACLKELLSPGRSVATSEVTAQAKKQGITESTLRRAKKELKVISYPVTQPDRKLVWFLRLPEEA